MVTSDVIALVRAVAFCLFGALLLLSPAGCFAQELLVLRSGNDSSLEDKQILDVAAFFGLSVQSIEADQEDALLHGLPNVIDPATLAIVISEGALNHSGWQAVVAALQTRNDRHVPILVYGITTDTPYSQLKLWSGGAVTKCVPVDTAFRAAVLDVGTQASITHQLGGRELPAVNSPVCGFESISGPTTETILSARQNDGKRASLLVRAVSSSSEVFLSAQTRYLESSDSHDIAALPDAFSSMAPFLFFLSHAAGEYAWHFDGHYANLTIDDAWLVQPYGYLDYTSLLVEMEEHNFHTTAAFVPWNFARSRPDVVALFKSHPDRYSICVHGNNHAHREFGDYRSNHLPDQVADIKQGIARMERFTALTHIPYDRFMVFPHAVAPEPTFAALRTYGFLGTANSSNVPLGEQSPRDPMFFLRPYTTDYASLLSYYRYPAAGEVPQLEVAIHAFLGNPILFYDHASLFSSGIGAFNAHADFVNHIQPDTKWTTLGEIARHSYLLRKRTNGGVDVLMLSSEMELENPADTEQVFYVHRNDRPGLGGTLTANSSTVQLNGSSEAMIVIPAHASKLLRMTYANDLDLAREEVSTRNMHVYALRMVSDFRDLYMSKSHLGEAFVRSYYRYRWDSTELFLEHNWWMIVAVVIIGFGGIRYHRSRTPRHTNRGAR